MNKELAQELLIKYRLGTCTPEEKALVDQWYLNEASRQTMPDSPHDPLQEEQLLWNRILSELPVEPKIRQLRRWYSIAAAIAGFAFISVGIYLWLNKPAGTELITNNRHQKNDIAPGSNKAILTLANGDKIILNGAQKGTLAKQDNTEIKKTAEGKVVYSVDEAVGKQNSAIQYNTMTTPRGGQYQLILPDGTKVLLNAASSLTYPTAFTGNDRAVKLTGEAYFEVAHNAAKPFKVSTNGQTVQVLGTHFNINAYTDEPFIKTTLLEGSVRISKGTQTAMLKPHQQAQLRFGDENPQIQIIDDVDIDEAVAWKNGQFVFASDDIRYIMRMISRWYDVDVEYNGAVPDDIFGGSVSRFNNVSEVLKILQLTGKVHFKIEERKIIVTK